MQWKSWKKSFFCCWQLPFKSRICNEQKLKYTEKKNHFHLCSKIPNVSQVPLSEAIVVQNKGFKETASQIWSVVRAPSKILSKARIHLLSYIILNFVKLGIWAEYWKYKWQNKSAVIKVLSTHKVYKDRNPQICDLGQFWHKLEGLYHPLAPCELGLWGPYT